MLFDTHVHLNDTAFDEDLVEVIERAKENDVTKMLLSVSIKKRSNAPLN
ncbi:putative deoxyribonuclease YabD [Listeria floridensis FSL S10-1187]|uniref:Deoxyribonuclease YabD n=1 Tax=Listeria floridensis FSL S10-1187 TaxID=1265817 RepID=A0ABP3AYE2_9LIST|nr:putative deoxyribonuclease YabD [Listeria floridensis FSL S10-1187]